MRLADPCLPLQLEYARMALQEQGHELELLAAVEGEEEGEELEGACLLYQPALD